MSGQGYCVAPECSQATQSVCHLRWQHCGRFHKYYVIQVAVAGIGHTVIDGRGRVDRYIACHVKYQEGAPGPRGCRIRCQHKNTLEIGSSAPPGIHGQIEGAFNGANTQITRARAKQFAHRCIGVGRVIDKQLSPNTTAMHGPAVCE